MINQCLRRLDAAYRASLGSCYCNGDYIEFEKIEKEYPEIAYEVAVDWWGD